MNVGPVNPQSEWVLTHAETSVKAIEDAFKEFTNREDIAIVMINQYVSIESPVTPLQNPFGMAALSIHELNQSVQSKPHLLRRLPT